MKIWFRVVASLFVALLINVAILFTFPPATTLAIIAKDIFSFLIGGVVLVLICKRKVPTHGA